MLQALDHLTLRADDMERTLSFYAGMLGLATGPRPPFAVAGHWLYAGGRPMVHLLEATPAAPAGRIDHVALRARGRAALEQRLASERVPYRLSALPDGSALQLFLQDPDGATLELVFDAREDR